MSFYCRCEYYFLKHIGKCWEAPFTPKSISLLFKIYSVFVIHFPKYISLKNKIFRYFVFLIVAFLVVISFLFTVLSHSSFYFCAMKSLRQFTEFKAVIGGNFFSCHMLVFFSQLTRSFLPPYSGIFPAHLFVH